jgi:ParB family chromosome partitioning protein
MPDQIRIPVEQIDPNPYQTRFEENTERIANIALSIAQDGLLQPPTVRKVDGRYQLAFGHTRSAGWKLCNWVQSGRTDGISPELIAAVENSQEDFSTMPVFPAEIEDEKMFRHAVTENAQRADLSPVEEATAMKKAMDEFKYTSEQAGALFGKSGATVRGKVRLLDLPETVRTQLHAGSLSESAARMMLVLSRMAPDRVGDALEDILDGEDPENLVDNILRTHKDVKRIQEENFPIAAKTFKYLPEMTEKELAKIDDEEKKAHLQSPPACTACPFYAKVDGDDYCSFITCFDRKQESQAITNLEAASKKTGIATYSKDYDGEFFVLDRWEDTHRKAVEKQDADLRLMKAGKLSSYWHYINQNIPMTVALVAVGKLGEKFKKAKIQSDIDRGKMPTDADPKEQAKVIKAQTFEQVVRDEYDRIMFETIAPFFLPMLETVKSEPLLELFADVLDPENELFDNRNENKLTGKARAKHVQLGIICELWERETSWDDHRKSYSAKLPVSELAKVARKLADKWGVKLGKDFDKAVADADVRINAMRQAAIEEALKDVSTATGKGKK